MFDIHYCYIRFHYPATVMLKSLVSSSGIVSASLNKKASTLIYFRTACLDCIRVRSPFVAMKYFRQRLASFIVTVTEFTLHFLCLLKKSRMQRWHVLIYVLKVCQEQKSITDLEHNMKTCIPSRIDTNG